TGRAQLGPTLTNNSRLHSPQTGSGGSSRRRKRCVSISPSVSIGYHFRNEKSPP
ncbi:unnamed protein product, partial [Allacma fusca]